MSEMVKRVARAIWKQRYGFEPLPRELEHDGAMEMARAAIAAMREPTEGMIQMMIVEIRDVPLNGEEVIALWERGLLEALR